MRYVEVNSEILHQNLRKSHRFSSKPIPMLESMGISIQRVFSLKCFNYRMFWEDAQSTSKHTTVVNKKKMFVEVLLHDSQGIDCLCLKGRITLVGSADRILSFLIIMSVKSGIY